MLAYILVISIIALFTLLSRRPRPGYTIWSITFAALTLFVGLRHKVGMDWNNYLFHSHRANLQSFSDALNSMEPGYGAILWLSAQMGFGIYGANLVGAAIFLFGVLSYARTTPSPWIALLVAFPYLIVVVGMSANRQSIAAGVILLAAANWQNYSFLRRVALISLSATFHYSALFFLVFTLYDLRLRKTFKLVLGATVFVATIYLLQVSGAAQTYDQLYITGLSDVIVSEGALSHILLNAGPALIWLLLPRYRAILLPNNLHRQMAIFAIALIPIALMYSTAASRISIYLFPVSMHIFSALPFVLDRKNTRIYTIICCCFFTFVLVFWLGFSNSGHAYLPYKNYLSLDSPATRPCC